jgi:hypothetical protein
MQNPNYIKELATAHCDYVIALLTAHEESTDIIELVRFHYTQSFIHGYKHGYHDANPDAVE